MELRGKTFWRQFLSAESTGMGIFYTLNVFCIQVSCRPAALCSLEVVWLVHTAMRQQPELMCLHV